MLVQTRATLWLTEQMNIVQHKEATVHGSTAGLSISFLNLICVNNHSGRSLYEAFSLAFLTELDQGCIIF